MKFYVHSVPGRLRVKHPLFKNKDSHYEVQKALVDLGHGIGTTDFNTTTGSLLINYDQREIDHRDILRRLERAGFYEPEQVVTNDEVIHRATASAYRFAAKTLTGAFIDTALQGTGLSFLAILL